MPSVAFAGSVGVRHVDAGSCNGCEIEVACGLRPGLRRRAVRRPARGLAAARRRRAGDRRRDPQHAGAAATHRRGHAGPAGRPGRRGLRPRLRSRSPAGSVSPARCTTPSTSTSSVPGVPAGARRHRGRTAPGDSPVTPVEVGLYVELVLAVAAAAVAVLARPPWRARLAGAATAALGVVGAVTGADRAVRRPRSSRDPAGPPDRPPVLSPTPLGGFFMVVAGSVGAVAARLRDRLRPRPVRLGDLVGRPGDVPARAADGARRRRRRVLPPGVGAHGGRLDRARAHRAPRAGRGPFRVVVVRRHDPPELPADPARLRRRWPLPATARASRRWRASTRRARRRVARVRAPGPGLRDQGRHRAPARVAAAGASRGTEPRLGRDERRDGEDGRLRRAPGRPYSCCPLGPQWWGLVLLALGAVSAVYGILQASVATDLKRLLAYSTTENVGLMFLAIGAGRAAALLRRRGPGRGRCRHRPPPGRQPRRVQDHAVPRAPARCCTRTGVRDLDRLGGLGTRMPTTALAFGIGALGAAALADHLPASWPSGRCCSR